jgi:hypothetical protein
MDKVQLKSIEYNLSNWLTLKEFKGLFFNGALIGQDYCIIQGANNTPQGWPSSEGLLDPAALEAAPECSEIAKITPLILDETDKENPGSSNYEKLQLNTKEDKSYEVNDVSNPLTKELSDDAKSCLFSKEKIGEIESPKCILSYPSMITVTDLADPSKISNLFSSKSLLFWKNILSKIVMEEKMDGFEYGQAFAYIKQEIARLLEWEECNFGEIVHEALSSVDVEYDLALDWEECSLSRTGWLRLKHFCARYIQEYLLMFCDWSKIRSLMERLFIEPLNIPVTEENASSSDLYENEDVPHNHYARWRYYGMEKILVEGKTIEIPSTYLPEIL